VDARAGARLPPLLGHADAGEAEAVKSGQLMQACADEAQVLILLSGLGKPERHLSERDQHLIAAGIHAGIGGTLEALTRLGMVHEPDA
jgi:hypothetical protein